ncbi:MAG: hypothetical protein ABW219_02605 [Ilumatobacteraceae bacterium]
MTALPGRRRRSTFIAAGLAGAGIAAAAALGTLGAVTLYNSTEGAEASSGLPELSFPTTPTALLAAVDGDGALASMAVLVVQPSGTGGSIVTVPTSADASAGTGPDRLPIAETMSLSGVEALGPEAEILLGLSLDDVEVVDAARLTELLAPIGPIDVDLPIDVTDGNGDVVAEAGEQTLDAAGAAAILTARDPSVPGARQYAAAAAVWAAIAAAADGGAATGPPGSAATPATTVPAASSGTIEARLAQLAAGPVGHRDLRVEPVAPDANPRGVDVVLLDPAELALVFGQVAPGKVAAPNSALSVRLISAFTDEQLAPSGLTNADVAYEAARQILAVGGNVRSVDTGADDADPPGETTEIELADETLVAGTDGADELFGPIEVSVGESRIVGVDAVIRLGTDYLPLLADGGPPMPSVPDDNGTDLAPGTTGPSTTDETPGAVDD